MECEKFTSRLNVVRDCSDYADHAIKRTRTKSRNRRNTVDVASTGADPARILLARTFERVAWRESASRQ